MKIHLTARRLKITEAIDNYVHEKVERAERYFDHLVWAQVTLFIEKRLHKTEIVIHGARQTFRALASAGDLYSAIDLATDKIDAQIKKYKERLKDHHKTPELDPKDAVPAIPGPSHFSIIKTPVTPITPEQAAEKMEELGHNFMLFENRSSKQLQVIYRRDDDSYCILQPVKKK